MIVQGRLDGIGHPPRQLLWHKKWNTSALWMIPKAGTFYAFYPEHSQALATATDLFADKSN